MLARILAVVVCLCVWMWCVYHTPVLYRNGCTYRADFLHTDIASRSQRVSLIVIPFCLSVWMSVGHSATYSLPRLIDHNQIWSAGIYLSSDPCKPFWIPYLPYFRCQRENMQNLATVHVTHRAIWLVFRRMLRCEIRVSPKMRVLPSGILSPNSGHTEKFATANRRSASVQITFIWSKPYMSKRFDNTITCVRCKKSVKSVVR